MKNLIGRNRAGNNRLEIINEAGDICKRLFAGGIKDINVYRELIDELVENHKTPTVIWILAINHKVFQLEEFPVELLRNSLIGKLLVL